MNAASLKTGIYYIQNRGTGTVIDLQNGSSIDGTPVQGYVKRQLSDNWVPAQLWIISQVGTNLYTIENANSRTYMDLAANPNGTPVLGRAGTGSDHQKWVITQGTHSSAYVIANKATGTYIDLNNGSSVNGTKVQGWAGSGAGTHNDHQLWQIIHA